MPDFGNHSLITPSLTFDTRPICISWKFFTAVAGQLAKRQRRPCVVRCRPRSTSDYTLDRFDYGEKEFPVRRSRRHRRDLGISGNAYRSRRLPGPRAAHDRVGVRRQAVDRDVVARHGWHRRRGGAVARGCRANDRQADEHRGNGQPGQHGAATRQVIMRACPGRSSGRSGRPGLREVRVGRSGCCQPAGRPAERSMVSRSAISVTARGSSS